MNVPGGAFFVVTACYGDGTESAPSNVVSGGGGEALLESLTIEDGKTIVATGTMFTDRVSVTIDDGTVQLPARIGTLVRGKLLRSSEAARLRQLLAGAAPARFTFGLTHGDIRPANVLVRPWGDCCLVDNEPAVNAYEYDLGRTWYRWPMRPEERAAYYEGYRQHRSTKEFGRHFVYWAVRVLVESAEFF